MQARSARRSARALPTEGMNDIAASGSVDMQSDRVRRTRCFGIAVSREIIARTIRESTADHPPRRGAIKAGTESDILSAVYTSDCSGFLQGLDLWVYGHTHERRDFTVGHPSERAEW